MNLNHPAYQPNGQPFGAYTTSYYSTLPVYQFINLITEDHVLTTNRYPGWAGYQFDGRTVFKSVAQHLYMYFIIRQEIISIQQIGMPQVLTLGGFTTAYLSTLTQIIEINIQEEKANLLTYPLFLCRCKLQYLFKYDLLR